VYRLDISYESFEYSDIVSRVQFFTTRQTAVTAGYGWTDEKDAYCEVIKCRDQDDLGGIVVWRSPESSDSFDSGARPMWALYQS